MASGPEVNQGEERPLLDRLAALERRVESLERQQPLIRPGEVQTTVSQHRPALAGDQPCEPACPDGPAAQGAGGGGAPQVSRAAHPGAFGRLLHASVQPEHIGSEPPGAHSDRVDAHGVPELGERQEQSFAERDSSSLDLEQLVGGRWYAVLGALAVTVGVVLFVKLAYDHGWLRVAPVWRCLGGAGFGLALIVTAGWLRRRFGTWAAFGACSAGLGAVYVSTYLAYRLYMLLAAPETFVLLGIVAVAGLLISVRARLQAVGVVSVLGGYLAPFLLSRAPSVPMALPAYLLMLHLVGMSLVAWRGGAFSVLRQVVTWGTLALGLVWVFGEGASVVWGAQSFLAGVWLITHGELTWSSVRASEQPAPNTLRRAGVAMLASIATTGWWAGLGVFLADRTGTLPLWLLPLAACAATLMLGMFLSGSGLILDRGARSVREAVGQSLSALAGAMFALAIALGLQGPGEVIAWLVLGAAAAIIGWRMRAVAVRVYACVLLAIGTGRLVLYDGWTGMATGGFALGGAVFTVWTAMMTLSGIAWLTTVATRRSGRPPRNLVDTGLTVAALLPVFAGVLHANTDAQSIAWMWLALAALAVALRGTVRMPLDNAGQLVALLPCIAWVAAVAWAGFGNGRGTPYCASISLQGLAIGGVCVAMGLLAWARDVGGRRSLCLVAVTAGLVLLFAASSIGVAAVAIAATDDLTVRRAAMSLWWGVAASGALVFGFVRSRAAVRHAGLALLGAAAIKVVTFDLAEVSPSWRIASFLVLGLMMLGVAVAYARAQARLKKPRIF
ncbi:MAG: DUF2339 domain-containing protein [Phycisphaerales bacterium]